MSAVDGYMVSSELISDGVETGWKVESPFGEF